ncbi:MAG: electron transport complex subunit RsxG [Nevskiales bacterium]|nr:electron transport complex subunit RsxG [Nevskiales bacterium]
MSAAPARPMLRAGALLAAFAIAAAGILAGVHALTADRIRQAEQQRLLQQLQAVLDADAYDNDIAADSARITGPKLPGNAGITVYRARRAGKPVAALLRVTAPDGYSGPIDLLIGIRYDGRLSGVRVVSHRETPGLGDKIDDQRSDWILGFAGRSLQQPPLSQWAVRKDGGVFDQFTGATITPRAVVRTVRDTLIFFRDNRDQLFDTPASASST